MGSTDGWLFEITFFRAAPNLGVGILRASSWWPTPRRHRQHCFFLGKSKPRGNFNFRSSSLPSSVTNHNLHNQLATTLEITNTLRCASLAPSRALCSSVSQGSRCAPPGASSCSVMWLPVRRVSVLLGITMSLTLMCVLVIVTWSHSVKSTHTLWDATSWITGVSCNFPHTGCGEAFFFFSQKP